MERVMEREENRTGEEDHDVMESAELTVLNADDLEFEELEQRLELSCPDCWFLECGVFCE